MQLKSLAITMGIGVAAGAVAIMMMPGNNPTRKLAAKAADKVESTYNALICDNRERLPTKLDSNTKFATKIKLQHGILNDFSIFIMLSQQSAIKQL